MNGSKRIDNLPFKSSWDWLIPVVDKIENFCKIDGKVLKLKDFFIIRNGLILINDNIFTLKEGYELKIENNEFYILVEGNFIKMNQDESRHSNWIFSLVYPSNYTGAGSAQPI